MGQSEIKTTEELFGSQDSKTTDEIKWAEPTQAKVQPVARGRNLGQQLAAPYHSFASGFYKGVGDIASDVSEFTQRAPTGQLARLINEKILGREPGWTREQFGKVTEPLTGLMGRVSEAQEAGGLGKSMLGQVYEGLGHFGATAPALYGLGAAGAGAATLPILEGVSGYAKEGLLGGVKGAIHGAMTHKILQGISVLPTTAQPVAALGFGYATTPGGVKERTAGGLTWATLGLAGGNRRVTKEDFISNYPKWGERIDESRAMRIVKQLAPELTVKEIKDGGGPKKLLEESLRTIEKDPTKPIEPERTTKTTQELEAGIATLKENYGKPDADRKTIKQRLREANSELKYVRKKEMQTNTPARRELDKALNAVRANEKILNDYAKLNEVPGAEHGIVKYKEGGTTEVTSKDVMELIKRGPDLSMGLIERRTTPVVWMARQYPFFRRLFERYHIADKAYLKEFEHTQKAYTNRWQKELKNDGLDLGNSSERIATYLTGLQKNGDAILKIMGKSKLTDADMTPAEMKIVTEARVVYDKMFKRINRARELAGKEPLEYVEDYFTWMRNLQQLEDAGVSLVEADAWVANVQLAATPLKYANTRKGLVKSGVILDFFQVFDGYAKDAIKHIHYTPFIAKGRALLEPHEIPSTKMKKDGTPGKITYSLEYDKPILRQQMKEWLDTVAGKSQLSNIPDYAKVQKGVAELNSNIAFAVLSANLRSAMIQFTAIRGAITEAGTSHTVKGVLQNLNPAMRKFAMQHSKVLFGRSVDIHVISAINQSTGGKIRNIKRALGEIGLKPLQVLDMETARGAWLSFYSKAGGKGIKSPRHKEAVRLADEAVLRTQASGKIGDVSPLQRGPTGRLISLFQTFTISEWNWIMRDVIGIKNPEANLGKNVVRAMRFMVTTTLINALFEDLLDVPSPFPAPEQAIIKGVQEGKGAVDTALSAGRELLEQIPVVGGAIKYSTDWKTNLPVPALQLTQDTIKLISKLSQGQIGKINEYDLETLGKALGIPGTSQARKFLVRIKRGQTIPEALIGVREGKKKTSGVDKYTPGIY